MALTDSNSGLSAADVAAVMNGGNYSNGSYRNDGRYMSGRGQYRTDSGYSRHYQEKESAMDKLEDMLRTASSDQEKAVIKKMMDKLYD